MDVLLASHSIGISDLREAPARAFEQANDHAVVVLNHNKPAGYIVSEKWMARMLDQMADMALMVKVDARMPNLHQARVVSLDDL
jgi:antitoxin StbD